MCKKTIAIQTLLGVGLYTISYVAVFSRVPGSTFLAPVMPKLETASIFVFAGVSIGAAGALLFLLGAINCLTKQARQQQWGWFVCTLIFGPLCLWLYLLAVSETPKPMVPVSIQPERIVYQPYTQGYGAPPPAKTQLEVYQEGRQQYPYPRQQQQQRYEDLMVMYPQE